MNSIEVVAALHGLLEKRDARIADLEEALRRIVRRADGGASPEVLADEAERALSPGDGTR